VLAILLLAAPSSAGARAESRPLRLTRAQLDALTDLAPFARPLASLGEWLRLGDGRAVWRPAAVGDGWRPYVDGSWSWTEDGWYWVSAEPWAWATYHFGRWRHDDRLGWTWIPGHEWAPAWVVWRRGAAAIGWAPRPDDGAVHAAHWTFVPERRFAGSYVPEVAFHATRLPTLLLHTSDAERGPGGPARADGGAPSVSAARAAP
jgi:hypothetical protein